jgi:FtsH-binding integral membrane protein
MIMSLITLIIYLAVVGLLYWLVIYAVDTIPIPDPPARIIKIVAMVILVLVIIILLLNLIGVSTGVDMPKLSS